MTRRLTFIIGCTASGKSGVGFELARLLKAEIVAVDSMKVYRRMDIGTAKPTSAQRAAVPYHLIDIVEPSDPFSVAAYVKLADAAITDIQRRGAPILVVGGTALYIKGLFEGLFEGPGQDPNLRAELRRRASCEGIHALHRELQMVDPQAAERIHPNDYRRIERALEVFTASGQPISTLQTQWRSTSSRYDCRFAGLRRPRQEQSRRINQRVRHMMESGLLDEVRALLAEPRPLSTQARQAVGYAELIDHLHGRIELTEAVERIKINSRRLAKHQRTWFRRFPGVTWFDVAEDEPADSVVQRVLTWYHAVP